MAKIRQMVFLYIDISDLNAVLASKKVYLRALSVQNYILGGYNTLIA